LKEAVMDALTLTTPPTEGEDVRRAQKLLAKNDYGEFYSGKIDGVFDEEMARACKRAKYWLGYTDAQLENDPKFHNKLEALLAGTTKLDAGAAKRRKARLQAEKEPLREKAFQVAKKHLGVKENPPESNKVLFSKFYGTVGPWCAMFVTYCYVEAGSKSFKKGLKWAYCPSVLESAKAGENHLSITKNPKRGDIVLYQFDQDANADHIGLFERFTDKSGKNFTAIEGNTSEGNDSNGGEVMRRSRSTSDVIAFVHVGAKV
jgi:hypothetical protein